MTGLIDLFVNDNIGQIVLIGINGNSSSRVKYLGFMNRDSMYNEMSKNSIGLMAFKKHWSHRFKSPNKAYEYAHAGLYVFCTSSFSSVIESFKGNCEVFEDYDDILLKLKYFRENREQLYEKRLKSFAHARSNLIWENYENNIFKAYKLC
jgi:glycosyltransferase involved in cell wall biosynthesis